MTIARSSNAYRGNQVEHKAADPSKTRIPHIWDLNSRDKEVYQAVAEDKLHETGAAGRREEELVRRQKKDEPIEGHCVDERDSQ